MNKALFRSRAVQSALARVFALYLRLALGTIRWRQEGREAAEAVWDSGGGVLVCFWHGRIALSPACWPLGRAQSPRALISLSPDGQFIAEAVARLGFPAIRGSAAAEGRSGGSKGGASAFRAALRWMQGGGGVAVTPDGPRGPPEALAPGVPALSRAARAPVLLVGLAARPALRLSSWDSAVIPLPFSRGAIAWERLDPPGREADEAALGAVGRDWGRRLSAATRRAEELVA